jgi:hypothetical protein
MLSVSIGYSGVGFGVRETGKARYPVYDGPVQRVLLKFKSSDNHNVTGRIGTGRAVRNREYQLDETRLDKEQIVNLSITYCKTIVN